MNQNEKICRICMDNTDLQPLFEFNDKFDNETIDLSHKINFCCNIECNVKDRMPNYICGVCSDALTVAYDLIMLCKYTDDLLRKNIGVVGESLSIEFEGVKIKTEYMPLDTNDVECSYDSCEDMKDEVRKSYKREHDNSQMSSECGRTKDKVVEIKTKTKKGSKKTNDVKKKQKRKKTEYVPLETKEVECSYDSSEERKFKVRKSYKRECENVFENSQIYDECDRTEDKDVETKLGKGEDDEKPVVKKRRRRRKKNSGSCVCEECGRCCKNQYELSRHRAMHEPKIYRQCPKCPYRTTDCHTYNIHMKFTHEGHPPLQCDMCSYQTIRKDYLKIHIMSHTGVRKYSCTLCDYKAINHSNLKRHMVKHTDARNYKCDICGAEYTANQRLKVHKLRVHEHLQMIYCTICPGRRKFIAEKTYKKHMLKVHPTDEATANLCGSGSNDFLSQWRSYESIAYKSSSVL